MDRADDYTLRRQVENRCVVTGTPTGSLGRSPYTDVMPDYANPFVHRLWPDRAPLAIGDETPDVPYVTVYLATGEGPRPAMVLMPGGGYGDVVDHEKRPIAEWLVSLGISVLELQYRHGPRYRHPAPLLDAQRAIRTARAMALEWNIDTQRVGAIGFSAGGHLCASVSNLFDTGDASAVDPVERQSCRPDVSVPVYPVISFTASFAHAGSGRNLLGEDATPERRREMSMETRVSRDTPPTFLFHTTEDKVVPVANTLVYAQALAVAGVPFELHVYEQGGHGVALGGDHKLLSTWPARCAAWLSLRGFTAS
jgi:acetyl esterase/lipase